MSDELKALLAREAIRDLPVRYCDCVWRDDIDGIVALFADDGSFTAELGDRTVTFSGHDDLRRMFSGGLGIQPRPFIHNHVVELLGDNFARGRAYLALHSLKQNFDFIGAGYYNDEYIEMPRGWCFQSRHFVALRMDDVPENLRD